MTENADSKSTASTRPKVKNTPPPKAQSKPKVESKAPPKGRKPKLQSDLEELVATLSLGLQTIGDDFSAAIVATQAESLAEAYYKLAQRSPAIKRVLETATTGSVWGEAVMATLAVAIPIAAYYNVIPRERGMMFAMMTNPDVVMSYFGQNNAPDNGNGSADSE